MLSAEDLYGEATQRGSDDEREKQHQSVTPSHEPDTAHRERTMVSWDGEEKRRGASRNEVRDPWRCEARSCMS